MRAFSIDLRKRAVSLAKSGRYTLDEIADLLGIGKSTIQKYTHQERVVGHLRPFQRKPDERAARNDPRIHAAVFARWEERNDSTLAEYGEAVEEHCGVVMGLPSMCRLLKKLGLRRKKNGSRDRTRS